MDTNTKREREKIRAVMCFSGPRRLFVCPVQGVRQVIETRNERRRLEEQI